MNLRTVVCPECVALHLKGSTKDEIIAELIDVLVAAGKLRTSKDRDEALRVVLERERKMSTGMQNGIAIPHGKTDCVDTLVAAVGINKEGVNFESLDNQPSRIFVMTLSPNTRTGPHIQFLAEISRALSDPKIRDRVLNAESAEQVLEALWSREK
jgi:PTS system nitrogen regulatory IIA component